MDMPDTYRWPIDSVHPLYGKCVMQGVTGGEQYRWFDDGDGVVSMMPLSVLGDEPPDVLEWDQEPDSDDWITDAGLKAKMRRGPSGHWCGYVGIPKGHPLYGKGYSHRIPPPAGFDERPMNDRVPAIPVLCHALCGDDDAVSLELAIDVHGGLTYAANHVPGDKTDGLWWFGFHCGHCDDLSPKIPAGFGTSVTYRNHAYVRAECEKLAEQLIALEAELARAASQETAMDIPVMSREQYERLAQAGKISEEEYWDEQAFQAVMNHAAARTDYRSEQRASLKEAGLGPDLIQQHDHSDWRE